MSIVFALLSSTLHQLWYSYNGVTQQFAQSLAVMAIGDFLGTALLLSVISSASKLIHRLTSPRL